MTLIKMGKEGYPSSHKRNNLNQQQPYKEFVYAQREQTKDYRNNWDNIFGKKDKK